MAIRYDLQIIRKLDVDHDQTYAREIDLEVLLEHISIKKVFVHTKFLNAARNIKFSKIS